MNVHAFAVKLGRVIDAKQDELDFGVTLLEGWDGAGGITT